MSNTDGTFSDIRDNDGCHAGDAIQGDLSTGALTANTSAAATVDAFTQSIVLGANLQNNSFTATIAGGTKTRTLATSRGQVVTVI